MPPTTPPSPANIVMLTPRTSVPLASGVPGVYAAIGSGVVCGSSSASRMLPSAHSVTSPWLDQMASTSRFPARSSALTNEFVSRITEPTPSLLLSALTIAVKLIGPLPRWRTETKSPAVR
jgi:hypothetical protein